MAMQSAEALKNLTIQGTNDWGAQEHFSVRFGGFKPEATPGDVFYCLSQFPDKDVLQDEDIEAIDFTNEGTGVVVLRSRSAYDRALLFHGAVFDGQSLTFQPEHPEPEPKPEPEPSPVPQQPVHEEPPPARDPPARDPLPHPREVQPDYPEEPPRDHYRGGGGGGDRDYRGGRGGRDFDRERDNYGGGGGGYRDRDRDDRRYDRGDRGYDRGGDRGYDRGDRGSYGRRDYDRGGPRYGGDDRGYGNRSYENRPPPRRPGDETLEMTAEELTRLSEGRKKIVIQKPVQKRQSSSSRAAPSSIFGDARPREEILKASTKSRNPAMVLKAKAATTPPQSATSPASSADSSGPVKPATSQSPRKGKSQPRRNLQRPLPTKEPKKQPKVQDSNPFEALGNE